MRRWTLACLGLLCVGLGGIGVVVPGLPTTIFLIAASWCFTRSCPWLEERLIRNRFFRPYLKFIDRGEPMPRRVMWITLAVMWVAIGLSTTMLWLGDTPIFVALCVPLAGVVGTVFIVRFAEDRVPGKATETSARCDLVSTAGATGE